MAADLAHARQTAEAHPPARPPSARPPARPLQPLALPHCEPPRRERGDTGRQRRCSSQPSLRATNHAASQPSSCGERADDRALLSGDALQELTAQLAMQESSERQGLAPLPRTNAPSVPLPLPMPPRLFASSPVRLRAIRGRNSVCCLPACCLQQCLLHACLLSAVCNGVCCMPACCLRVATASVACPCCLLFARRVLPACCPPVARCPVSVARCSLHASGCMLHAGSRLGPSRRGRR